MAPTGIPQDRLPTSVTWSGWPDLNRRPLRPEAISADMPWSKQSQIGGHSSYLGKRSEWVALSRPGPEHVGPYFGPHATPGERRVHPTSIKIDEGFMALKSPAGAEAMDDRLAEHALDRCGQGLGSVEDGQDGPAGVQAEVSRSPVIRSVTTAAFSVEPAPRAGAWSRRCRPAVCSSARPGSFGRRDKPARDR